MMPDASGFLKIEIAFGDAARQQLTTINVPAGTTVGDALRQSGVHKLFAAQNLSVDALGIWGRIVTQQQPVKDGDRIEIYRPLLIDPGEARRQLATEGKFMGNPPTLPIER